ncbi:MAG: hypothetical protein JXR73_19965 [Candidatus Omnitrophica bacterium]|nr:hypothetical protein [Candidatus Omnitrophota bacterium]
MRNILLVIPLAFFLACAQSTEKTLTIRNVGGDLWIRSICSDNINQASGAGTEVATETTGLPIRGIPSIKSNIVGKGIFADSGLVIESVSGSVYIEEAGNRNQEQQLNKILERLFLPGNPFSLESESESKIE